MSSKAGRRRNKRREARIHEDRTRQKMGDDLIGKDRCACGKVVFNSRDDATAASVKLDLLLGRITRAYECPGCPGTWHLTHVREDRDV